MKMNASFSVGKGMRSSATKTALLVPGPGTYDQRNATKPQEPQYRFGTQKRNSKAASTLITPGPGTYGFKEHVGQEATAAGMHKKLSYKTIE